MEPAPELLRRTDIPVPGGTVVLSVHREDLTRFYPGMFRYTARIRQDHRILFEFVTNTYEYSPNIQLEAESVAMGKADEWEEELRAYPEDFIESLKPPRPRCEPAIYPTDVVVIQGSPRADGNCSIIAGWCADEVRALDRTVQVLYIDDMEIAPCIGCYQCYNTGTCTFDDDMDGIIRAIRDCSLLVVCTPVYTNTVPGGLKMVIDRCQAYHAERSLRKDERLKHGLLFSVAGRKGKENFACVTKVVRAYLQNLGITPAGEVLVDGLDVIRDVRTIGGLEEQVREAVRRCGRVVEPQSPGRRQPS